MFEHLGLSFNFKGRQTLGTIAMADDGEDADALAVTSPTRIQRYLREIHRANLELSVTPAVDGGRKYYTHILRIEQETGLIVLHQLLPADWRRQFASRTRVEVSCKLQSGTIRFSADITPLDRADNLSYCVLTLPERVKRHQLRSYFRVPLLKYDSRLTVLGRDGGDLAGSVKDLSLGGLLCHFRCSEGEFAVGESLESCRLEIAGLLTLEFSASVRHIRPLEGGLVQAGLKFDELSPARIKDARQAISKVERDNIRKDLA